MKTFPDQRQMCKTLQDAINATIHLTERRSLEPMFKVSTWNCFLVKSVTKLIPIKWISTHTRNMFMKLHLANNLQMRTPAGVELKRKSKN